MFQVEATLPDAETKEIEVTGQASNGRELLLNIPPRLGSFDKSRSGKGLLMSHGSVKESPSSGGFLRGLSFKKKKILFDVEETSLLNAETSRGEDNRFNGMSNRPVFSWKRSTSLPVAHGSNLSTSVTIPSSARVYTEQHEVLIFHLIFFQLFIGFIIKLSYGFEG